MERPMPAQPESLAEGLLRETRDNSRTMLEVLQGPPGGIGLVAVVEDQGKRIRALEDRQRLKLYDPKPETTTLGWIKVFTIWGGVAAGFFAFALEALRYFTGTTGG